MHQSVIMMDNMLFRSQRNTLSEQRFLGSKHAVRTTEMSLRPPNFFEVQQSAASNSGTFFKYVLSSPIDRWVVLHHAYVFVCRRSMPYGVWHLCVFSV